MVMKKILVPIDFSANSRKALDYATEIAKRCGAEIILLHITEATHASLNEYVILEGDYDRELIKNVNSKLEIMAQAAREVGGVPVKYEVYNGFVPDAIKAATKKNHADLIIMGTVGDSGVREKLFGSMTAAVIGQSTIPVLAIPLLAEAEPPENILLAVHDFTEHHETADTAFFLAELFKIPVQVTVFTDERLADAADYINNRRQIEFFTKSMQQKYPGIKIESTPIYGHNFEEALKTHIASNNTGLLVMLTHKRSFLESLFHRSMTKKMSYHTNIPLLSIPIENKNK
jgi:nucleotide-binding universal stress UspA family protein